MPGQTSRKRVAGELAKSVLAMLGAVALLPAALLLVLGLSLFLMPVGLVSVPFLLPALMPTTGTGRRKARCARHPVPQPVRLPQ